MKGIGRNIISCFFLLCILAGVFPIGLFHGHEQDTHCHPENATLENNPCHISIYHANESQNQHCNHQSHLLDHDDECQFCKFLSVHQHKYAANKQQDIVLLQNSETRLIFEACFSHTKVCDSFSGRAPPVC